MAKMETNHTYNMSNPWIARREPTICTWKPDYNRGYINNMSVSLKADFTLFSEQQIIDYVRMMKAFGFNGIQVCDGCYNWRTGSYKFIHSQYRRLANALHAEGMSFTYWIWAASFDGHGWHDDDVVYTSSTGGSAYDDPAVFACFNKYYDIYAELADVTDLLIAHFNDPGYLRDKEDIFAFTRLLESKFRAINPNIRMGVDTWGSPDSFPGELVNAGFKDYLLMELPFIPSWREPGKRARFREGVKRAGCELGMWGWYTAEYEIDQLASMYVNSKVLKDVYNRTRSEGDSVMVPTYWSEMDSNHVINLFSMYCSGQLLIDPERDPAELLREIAYMIYGNEHGETVLQVLHLIEDARSGDSWETYWWTEAGYVLGGHDPADILKRAEALLPELRTASRDHTNRSSIPLPLEPYEILELILPHVDQILQYARFRLDMEKLRKMRDDGADKEALYNELDRIWNPIPNYNTVVGVFGQIEARAQNRTVYSFARECGFEPPKRPGHRFDIKKHYVENLIGLQRGRSYCVYVNHDFFEGGNLFPDENEAVIHELVSEGVFAKKDDALYLSNWRDYLYDTN